MNGYANGHAPPELQQDTTFLFTSESVGEGHPGERSGDHPRGRATPIAGPYRVTLHYRSEKAFVSLSISFFLSPPRSTSPVPCGFPTTTTTASTTTTINPRTSPWRRIASVIPEGACRAFSYPFHFLPRTDLD